MENIELNSESNEVVLEATEVVSTDSAEAISVEDAAVEETALEAVTENIPENLITDRTEIKKALEAMIFASPKAISLKRIKGILGSFQYATDEVADILEEIASEFENRGFQLTKVAGAYQFRTSSTQSDILQKLLEDRPVRLSTSALEVLAIIAYKQPVSRAEIDAVRGVDSSHLTRGLLDKNLIRSLGHAETPGRPLLLGTTPYFLEVFGLNSLDDLPSPEDFEKELANKEGQSEGEANVLAGDPEGLEQAALFHDTPSPLAANPDRGDFDEIRDEENEAPDFGLKERALDT